MNRLFLIALLALATGPNSAHAGYYDRVPNTSDGRYQPSPEDQQRDLQRQQMQNEMQQRQQQRQGEMGPDMRGPRR